MKKENATFSQCHHILAKEETNLYLGGVGALKPEIMEAFQYGAVLTIMDPYMFEKLKVEERVKERGIKTHLLLEQEDDEESDIMKHFEAAHSFIDQNLSTKNVLVHCQAGVSRSGTIVISYIMKKLKLSAQQATKFVRSRRYVVSPNQGFSKALEDYEKLLQKSKDFETKISAPQSLYSNEQYYSKYCNHIICFDKDGNMEKQNLFLGQASAISYQYMSKYKISAVLTIIDQAHYNRLQIQPKISHLGIKQFCWIDAKDNSSENIIDKLEQAHTFVKENLEKGNVFVHCQMGVSRSASVVISYLMNEFKTDFYDAEKYTRSKRPQVKVNPGFEEQLRKFEKNSHK